MRRVSQPVGIGTALFAGVIFAALLGGESFGDAAARAAIIALIGFGVSFGLLSMRARRDDD